VWARLCQGVQPLAMLVSPLLLTTALEAAPLAASFKISTDWWPRLGRSRSPDRSGGAHSSKDHDRTSQAWCTKFALVARRMQPYC
jgi:hypothetical protein